MSSVVPLYAAKGCSGGLLARAAFERITTDCLSALRAHAAGADALYFSLHGAMGAEGELDPEGFLLEEARRILGPEVPIVISLDLHGIVTARMLRNCTAAAVYHTYPHQDFTDTGARAARLLVRILDHGVRPVMARVKVPALVRGPELITATGCYGEIIGQAKRLEQAGALAAAMLIGNPFTDVPELCSQSLVITDGDAPAARSAALAMAAGFLGRAGADAGVAGQSRRGHWRCPDSGPARSPSPMPPTPPAAAPRAMATPSWPGSWPMATRARC